MPKKKQKLPLYFETFLKNNYRRVSDQVFADLFEVDISVIEHRRLSLKLVRVTDYRRQKEGRTKLSNKTRAEIYEDFFANKMRLYKISKKYNITTSTAARIIDSVSGNRAVKLKKANGLMPSKINFE